MSSFVFDLDGVLCRNGYFTEQLERVHGVPRSRWGSFFTSVMTQCIVGRADLRIEIARIIPQLGWVGSVDELLSFWFESERLVCEKVIAVVVQLRRSGIRCYLGTNQERYRTSYISDVMGLRVSFDGIFSSCHLAVAKPSSEFYAKVQASVGDSDICLVDDSATNVIAAEKFGWRAILYRGPQDIPLIVKEANQSLEPMARSVTHPADAGCAPALTMAHH